MKVPGWQDALAFGGQLARAGARTLGVFGGSTAVALAYTPVALATRGDLAVGGRWTRRWAQALVRGFGLRVEVQGALPQGGALIVSNHRSYVDIAALGSLFDACFIAKAQIRHWPVLGFAFAISPTLFVDRGNPDSTRAVRQAVRDRLARGLSIINFAEGTTKDGPGLLPFKRGLFKEALALDIPVVPVTLTYTGMEHRDTGMEHRVEWVGDDTFLDHFLRLAGHQGLTAHVHILPPHPAGKYLEQDLDLFVGAIRRAMLEDLRGREPIDPAEYPELTQ